MNPTRAVLKLNAVDLSLLKFNHSATLSYGKRVTFVDPENPALIKTNPRNEIGKFGIKYRTGIGRLLHQTVKIAAWEPEKKKERTFYLDRIDTINWINSQKPIEKRIQSNISDKTLVKKINHLSKSLAKQEAEKSKQNLENGEKTYPIFTVNRSLNNFTDRLKSLYWGLFTKGTYHCWHTLQARFALRITEERINKAAEILAVNAYRKARECVPAYQAFLNAQETQPTKFCEITPTTKDNYIKPAHEKGEYASLYQNGEIPKKSKRDTSTGTSGPATAWYRGEKEQRHVEKLTLFAARTILGDKPYTFINGFAMGPWATGVTATLAMNSNPKVGICVIGPNIAEIYSCIKEQIAIHGKNHPIVVSGYPPHIRAVVDLAVAEGFPLHECNVIAVVGGEAMSEDLRDLLVTKKNGEEIARTGFKQCYSSYGASDLDITLANESDFEIELRKLCHDPKYADLAEELFGKNEFIPMIFHSDPLNYLIETGEGNELIYTCTRDGGDDRISPRIRYKLGDKGKTMAVSDVLAILKKYGVELKNKPNTNLPLLFVWGRQGSHISYRGCKIAPENLSEAILRLDESSLSGLNKEITHYGFYQYEANGRTITEILLEMSSEEDFQRYSQDDTLLESILAVMHQRNSDVASQLDASPPDEKPVLRLFRPEESPMHVQQERYAMRKKQYIFKAGDEFIPNHASIEDKGCLITLHDA